MRYDQGRDKPLSNNFSSARFDEFVFTRDVGSDLRDLDPESLQKGIWVAVSARKVDRSILSKRKAIGPDGITSQQLRKIPSEFFARMLNVMLHFGPQRLLESRTVLSRRRQMRWLPRTSVQLQTHRF